MTALPPVNSNSSSGVTRRQFAGLAAASACGLGLSATCVHFQRRFRQPRTAVTILKAESYGQSLEALIRQGLRNYPAVIRKAREGVVLLKPNLVDYSEGLSINTHPAVVAAAIAAFRSAGARHVIVAEGPGHRHDMEVLLARCGLKYALEHERTPFVDLNLNPSRPVRLAADYTKLGQLYIPEAILGAALVVSMPKLKTHHWAGVTISMKNLFGVVPGSVYGVPKGILHRHGITNSIADINLAVRPGFAIVDGIEGMEGDGPLAGTTVPSGVLLMGDNLTAVDATGARVMGLHPERIPYLTMMSRHGGTLAESRIEQRGEPIADVRRDFRVLEDWAALKRPSRIGAFLEGL